MYTHFLLSNKNIDKTWTSLIHDHGYIDIMAMEEWCPWSWS